MYVIKEVKSMETAFEGIAIAIIVQAAKNYQTVLKRLDHSPFDVKLLLKRAEIEQFFHSHWCECLTTVDGIAILWRLQNDE